MSIKNTFQGMSSWTQLIFLCLFVFVGFIFASLFIGVIAAVHSLKNGTLGDAMSLMQSTNFLRISQFASVIFLFLIPALLCAYLYNNKPIDYLKLNRRLDAKFTFVSVALIFITQPLISFTSHLNQKMKLPSFMSGIEQWMQSMEKSAAETMEILMMGDTVTTLIINLIIVAVMAAIAEELFFRGVIQQIFNKITRNHHVAIWVTAVIFSAIHLQFYGFFPRLLLGALLGYLFVWSKNLWVPIIVHFANNAMAVIIYWLYHGTPEYDKIENIGIEDFWWTTLLSVLLTGIILVFLSNEYKKKHKYAEF